MLLQKNPISSFSASYLFLTGAFAFWPAIEKNAWVCSSCRNSQMKFPTQVHIVSCEQCQLKKETCVKAKSRFYFMDFFLTFSIDSESDYFLNLETTSGKEWNPYKAPGHWVSLRRNASQKAERLHGMEPLSGDWQGNRTDPGWREEEAAAFWSNAFENLLLGRLGKC